MLVLKIFSHLQHIHRYSLQVDSREKSIPKRKKPDLFPRLVKPSQRWTIAEEIQVWSVRMKGTTYCFFKHVRGQKLLALPLWVIFLSPSNQICWTIKNYVNSQQHHESSKSKSKVEKDQKPKEKKIMNEREDFLVSLKWKAHQSQVLDSSRRFLRTIVNIINLPALS